MHELKSGRTEPTNEVGDEGGSPGDTELERRPVAVTGSEATTTFDAKTQIIEHRHYETRRGAQSLTRLRRWTSTILNLVQRDGA